MCEDFLCVKNVPENFVIKTILIAPMCVIEVASHFINFSMDGMQLVNV